jgi:hypothetical protein
MAMKQWGLGLRVDLVNKISIHFWNQRKNTDLLIPMLTNFKKKNVWPRIANSLLFCNQKGHFRKKWLKIKINIFCNLVSEFWPQFNSALGMSKFQNHYYYSLLPVLMHWYVETQSHLTCAYMLTWTVVAVETFDFTEWPVPWQHYIYIAKSFDNSVYITK